MKEGVGLSSPPRPGALSGHRAVPLPVPGHGGSLGYGPGWLLPGQCPPGPSFAT